jgi:hypothetical protein
MVALPGHVVACACQKWLHSSHPDVLELIDAAGFVHAIQGLGISIGVMNVVQVSKVPLLC